MKKSIIQVKIGDVIKQSCGCNQVATGIGHEEQWGAVRFTELHHGTLRAAAITESQERLPISHASKHTHLAVLIVEHKTRKPI